MEFSNVPARLTIMQNVIAMLHKLTRLNYLLQFLHTKNMLRYLREVYHHRCYEINFLLLTIHILAQASGKPRDTLSFSKLSCYSASEPELHYFCYEDVNSVNCLT